MEYTFIYIDALMWNGYEIEAMKFLLNIDLSLGLLILC